MFKLAIDPGHGLGNRLPGVYDPGTVATLPDGRRLDEADVTLRWALTLKHLAGELGIHVFLTRTSAGEASPLGRRVARAKAAECTHLLSLHCNAAPRGLASGTETLYDPRTGIKAFAWLVQDTAVAALGLTVRGVKERTDLAILRFPGPAALLELGFLAHPIDQARLLDRERRILFARTLLTQFQDLYDCGCTRGE